MKHDFRYRYAPTTACALSIACVLSSPAHSAASNDNYTISNSDSIVHDDDVDHGEQKDWAQYGKPSWVNCTSFIEGDWSECFIDQEAEYVKMTTSAELHDELYRIPSEVSGGLENTYKIDQTFTPHSGFYISSITGHQRYRWEIGGSIYQGAFAEVKVNSDFLDITEQEFDLTTHVYLGDGHEEFEETQRVQRTTNTSAEGRLGGSGRVAGGTGLAPPSAEGSIEGEFNIAGSTASQYDYDLRISRKGRAGMYQPLESFWPPKGPNNQTPSFEVVKIVDSSLTFTAETMSRVKLRLFGKAAKATGADGDEDGPPTRIFIDNADWIVKNWVTALAIGNDDSATIRRVAPQTDNPPPSAPGSVPVYDPELDCWFSQSTIASRGLTSDPAHDPGRFRVFVDDQQDHEVLFQVTASPAGIVDIEPQLEISAGGSVGSVLFTPLAAGTAVIRANRLDEFGQPTGVVVAAIVQVQDLSAFPDTELFVNWSSSAGGEFGPSSNHLILPAGSPAAQLYMRRKPFSGWETTASQVALSYDDPQGILSAPFLASMTIPAGERDIFGALQMSGATGTASIFVDDGTTIEEFVLESSTQGWSGPLETVVAPLGSRVNLFAILDMVDSSDRQLSASTDDASVLSVRPGHEQRSIIAGSTFTLTGFVANSLGTTTARLSDPSGAIAELSATVEVVPAKISFANGALHLSDMGDAAGKMIELGLYADGAFTSVTPPSGYGNYLELHQPDPQTLQLRFLDGASVPEDLSIDIELSSVAIGSTFCSVADNVHIHPVYANNFELLLQ